MTSNEFAKLMRILRSLVNKSETNNDAIQMILDIINGYGTRGGCSSDGGQSPPFPGFPGIPRVPPSNTSQGGSNNNCGSTSPPGSTPQALLTPDEYSQIPCPYCGRVINLKTNVKVDDTTSDGAKTMKFCTTVVSKSNDSSSSSSSDSSGPGSDNNGGGLPRWGNRSNPCDTSSSSSSDSSGPDNNGGGVAAINQSNLYDSRESPSTYSGDSFWRSPGRWMDNHGFGTASGSNGPPPAALAIYPGNPAPRPTAGALSIFPRRPCDGPGGIPNLSSAQGSGSGSPCPPPPAGSGSPCPPPPAASGSPCPPPGVTPAFTQPPPCVSGPSSGAGPQPQPLTLSTFNPNLLQPGQAVTFSDGSRAMFMRRESGIHEYVVDGPNNNQGLLRVFPHPMPNALRNRPGSAYNVLETGEEEVLTRERAIINGIETDVSILRRFPPRPAGSPQIQIQGPAPPSQSGTQNNGLSPGAGPSGGAGPQPQPLMPSTFNPNLLQPGQTVTLPGGESAVFKRRQDGMHEYVVPGAGTYIPPSILRIYDHPMPDALRNRLGAAPDVLETGQEEIMGEGAMQFSSGKTVNIPIVCRYAARPVPAGPFSVNNYLSPQGGQPLQNQGIPLAQVQGPTPLTQSGTPNNGLSPGAGFNNDPPGGGANGCANVPPILRPAPQGSGSGSPCPPPPAASGSPCPPPPAASRSPCPPPPFSAGADGTPAFTQPPPCVSGPSSGAGPQPQPQTPSTFNPNLFQPGQIVTLPEGVRAVFMRRENGMHQYAVDGPNNNLECILRVFPHPMPDGLRNKIGVHNVLETGEEEVLTRENQSIDGIDFGNVAVTSRFAPRPAGSPQIQIQGQPQTPSTFNPNLLQPGQAVTLPDIPEGVSAVFRRRENGIHEYGVGGPNTDPSIVRVYPHPMPDALRNGLTPKVLETGQEQVITRESVNMNGIDLDNVPVAHRFSPLPTGIPQIQVQGPTPPSQSGTPNNGLSPGAGGALVGNLVTPQNPGPSGVDAARNLQFTPGGPTNLQRSLNGNVECTPGGATTGAMASANLSGGQPLRQSLPPFSTPYAQSGRANLSFPPLGQSMPQFATPCAPAQGLSGTGQVQTPQMTQQPQQRTPIPNSTIQQYPRDQQGQLIRPQLPTFNPGQGLNTCLDEDRINQPSSSNPNWQAGLRLAGVNERLVTRVPHSTPVQATSNECSSLNYNITPGFYNSTGASAGINGQLPPGPSGSVGVSGPYPSTPGPSGSAGMSGQSVPDFYFNSSSGSPNSNNTSGSAGISGQSAPGFSASGPPPGPSGPAAINGPSSPNNTWDTSTGSGITAPSFPSLNSSSSGSSGNSSGPSAPNNAFNNGQGLSSNNSSFDPNVFNSNGGSAGMSGQPASDFFFNSSSGSPNSNNTSGSAGISGQSAPNFFNNSSRAPNSNNNTSGSKDCSGQSAPNYFNYSSGTPNSNNTSGSAGINGQSAPNFFNISSGSPNSNNTSGSGGINGQSAPNFLNISSGAPNSNNTSGSAGISGQSPHMFQRTPNQSQNPNAFVTPGWNGQTPCVPVPGPSGANQSSDSDSSGYMATPGMYQNTPRPNAMILDFVPASPGANQSSDSSGYMATPGMYQNTPRPNAMNFAPASPGANQSAYATPGLYQNTPGANAMNCAPASPGANQSQYATPQNTPGPNAMNFAPASPGANQSPNIQYATPGLPQQTPPNGNGNSGGSP